MHPKPQKSLENPKITKISFEMSNICFYEMKGVII
jgi:hypothetical protein